MISTAEDLLDLFMRNIGLVMREARRLNELKLGDWCEFSATTEDEVVHAVAVNITDWVVTWCAEGLVTSADYTGSRRRAVISAKDTTCLACLGADKRRGG